MGGIVHVHIPAANIVSRKHEVVDGQQRMATFTLTMASILRGLSKISEQSQNEEIKGKCAARSDEIREAFIVYRETQGAQRVEVPKLQLSRTDEPFFRALLNGENATPSRESHHRLKNAIDAIDRELILPIIRSCIPEEEKLDQLIHLYKVASEQCVVIHIVSQNRREAYRLFSVLNDRGRNLTDGDLLRARTLELLEGHPTVQNEVEQLWDIILDGKPEDITKYLKAYFPSVTGRRAPNKDLFDTYEQEFLQSPSTDSTRAFVRALATDKRFFEAIRQGEWPFLSASHATSWDRDRLHRLVNILRHEAAHPLLLSAVKLGENKFIHIVRLLERFVFRYITIVGAHPSPLYKPYNAEAKKIRDQVKTYQVSSLKNELNTLVSTRASDTAFSTSLLAKLEYSDNTARNREIKHFFSTLESYRRWYERGGRRRPTPDTMTVIDVAAATLEHIYPNNPSPADVDPAMEPLKQRLGNLTIMAGSDNSAIGNLPFSLKKTEFAKSSIGLTQQLASYSVWNAAELQTREDQLMTMALSVFKIS